MLVSFSHCVCVCLVKRGGKFDEYELDDWSRNKDQYTIKQTNTQKNQTQNRKEQR